jgi:methylenetetrahydrofolate reductase (NADPH)
VKIIDCLNSKPVTLSFEVFPPKTDDGYESVAQAVTKLSALHPDYISVTYGAGGGTSKNTVRIASEIQGRLATTALPHLSCVSSSREEVSGLLDQMAISGIHNVLALRGDRPAAAAEDYHPKYDYEYAFQLISDIKKRDKFCIGAACYPEGHVECINKAVDLGYLKEKVDCGVDFLVTQMFFDNNVLFSFLYQAYRKNIQVPVVAGIWPVTAARQIQRIAQLSGAAIPTRLKGILDKWGHDPESMKQAGIIYATEQIIDLVANGVRGIHIYTMNKPEVAQKIQENLGSLLK